VTTSSRADCDFCAIARGENDRVEVVCDDERWVAFFPLEPATPGHTLIIPREHVQDFWAAPPDLAAELARAALRVGRAIQEAVIPEGMNLITSSGAAAEQTVFHLHLHVVPRWRRDGFGAIWPREPRYEDESLLEGIADRIRAACAAE
jgi:histidine triad (HIT) family protein